MEIQFLSRREQIISLLQRRISAMWKEIIHGFENNAKHINTQRQAEIHAAEPLVPEPSAFELELATEKLKSHKSPGIDQIPAELIKAGSRTIRCAFRKLIISFWNKEELPEE